MVVERVTAYCGQVWSGQ